MQKPPTIPIFDIWLNKGERALLKRLAKIYPNSMSKEAAFKYLKSIKKYDTHPAVTLQFKELVSCDNDKNLKIIRRGLNWLELYQSRRLKELFPNAVSILALIISVIAIINS